MIPNNSINAIRLYNHLKSNIYWQSMKELAQTLKCSEREIRASVNEINMECADNSFDHVIVTGNKGYKVAETREEIMEAAEQLYKMGETLCKRANIMKHKANKHQQQMLKTSPYHRTEFRAIISEDEKEKARNRYEEMKACR